MGNDATLGDWPTLPQTLDRLTPDDCGLAFDSPENWMQGRTLLGGLTAVLQVETARRTIPDLPPLRSSQFTFVGPATGRLTFTAELLRRGRNSAIVGVDCTGEAGVAARAMLTFANARESVVAHDHLPMPDVPAPEACEDYRKPDWRLPRAWPDNFDMLKIEGTGRPFGGGAPLVHVWSRCADDTGVDPAQIAIALGDGIPPAAMSLMPERGAVSTVTWTVDFFQPLTMRGWHLLHSRSEQAADGYSLQHTDIWDRSGRRVAVARQVVTVFV